MQFPFEWIRGEYLSNYLDDFPPLAVELCKYGVISDDILDRFLSLDLEHLKPGDIALRYLLQQMLCEKREEVQEVILRVERTRNRVVGNSRYVCDAIINELYKVKAKEPKVCSEEDPSAEKLLNESDVSGLTVTLAEGSDKWEELSIDLGIPRYVRKDIDVHKSNVIKLSDVLYIWIMGDYAGSRPATLDNLKLALRSEIVGLSRLAIKLCQYQRNEYSSPKKSKADTKLEMYYRPCSTKVYEDKSTLLEVQVISNDRECYQWNKDDVDLPEGAGFSGVSSNILFINEMTKEKEGKYFCSVRYNSEHVRTNVVNLDMLRKKR